MVVLMFHQITQLSAQPDFPCKHNMSLWSTRSERCVFIVPFWPWASVLSFMILLLLLCNLGINKLFEG